MIRGFFFAALLVLSGPITAVADDCAEDMVRFVKGGDGCFAILTTLAAEPAEGKPLVILLHGDSGPTHQAKERLYGSYGTPIATLKDKGVNSILVSRPGYRLPDWSQTAGFRADTWDNYTPEIVAAIADAVARLKAHYKPSRMVLLGHSGGAMIGGIIAGRHPDTVDAAVLVGWACDTPSWRTWRGNTTGRNASWSRSLSASDFLDNVPPAMPVVAITGEKDNNTKASFASDCVERLKGRGVPARLDVVSGEGHNSVMMKPVVTDAVLEVAGN